MPQPRGCGIKIFNVHGDFLPGGEGFATQDIEFNSTMTLDLADAKTSREIIDLRIKDGGNRQELYKHLEARKDVALQNARDQVRNTHLEALSYSVAACPMTCKPVNISSKILPGPLFRNATEAVRRDRQAQLPPRPHPERLAARIPLQARRRIPAAVPALGEYR
jgi:hypothetical protein